MWKYGYKITDHKSGIGPKLVDLRVSFDFDRHYLFSKMQGAGKVTVYIRHGQRERKVYATLFVKPLFVSEWENIAIGLNEELFIGFEGMTKKEHSMMASLIRYQEHLVTEDMVTHHNFFEIPRGPDFKATDVFNHKWR